MKAKFSSEYYMEPDSHCSYRALITLMLPSTLPPNLINLTEVMGQVLDEDWGHLTPTGDCRQRQHELRGVTLDELKGEVTAYIKDTIALLRSIKFLPEPSVMEVDI